MTFRTTDVALRIQVQSARDQWSLADAILVDVPARPEGGDQRSLLPTSNSDDGPRIAVATELFRIVEELSSMRITAVMGEPYSVATLRDLRAAAMAWSPDDRQAEASFTTHVEAMGPGRRAVLVGLCRIARGESVDRLPPDVASDDWNEATANIRERIANGKARRGFVVIASDVRVAMGRRRKDARGTPSSLVELATRLADIGESVRAFSAAYDAAEVLPDEHRLVIQRRIDETILALSGLRQLVCGFSDDDFAQLLAEGRS